MTQCGCAVQRYGQSAAWARETSELLESGALSLHGMDAEDYMVAQAFARARARVERKRQEEAEWLAELKAKKGAAKRATR